MGIVGDHPEGGVRFDLERITAASPWAYQGSAFTPDGEHRIHATVDARGDVSIDDASLPDPVVQRAKLLLRTAWKRAKEISGESAPVLPRRIHRWRAE